MAKAAIVPVPVCFRAQKKGKLLVVVQKPLITRESRTK